MPRVACTMALLSAATLVACGGGPEFVHSNPFDPVVPVTLRIEGPDKTVAQFDTVRFKLVTDPAYDYGSAVWSATGGLEKVDDNGTYRAPRTGVFTGPVQVTATLGPRKAEATIMVTYQPASFRMRNCTDSSRTIRIVALDTAETVCTTVYDARGGVISVYGIPITLAVTSLDTSIASAPTPGQIKSVGNGTTKVVYSFNNVSDTLDVVVHQEVASLTLNPSTCSARSIVIPLGSTLQLSLAAPAFDATGHPVTDTTEIQNAIATARWGLGYTNVMGVSVDQGGLVTGTFQTIYPSNPYANTFSIVTYSWLGKPNFGGGCYIGVSP